MKELKNNMGCYISNGIAVRFQIFSRNYFHNPLSKNLLFFINDKFYKKDIIITKNSGDDIFENIHSIR